MRSLRHKMVQEFVPRKQQRQTQTEKWNSTFWIQSPQIKMYNFSWRPLALCRPNQRALGFFFCFVLFCFLAYWGGLCPHIQQGSDLSSHQALSGMTMRSSSNKCETSITGTKASKISPRQSTQNEQDPCDYRSFSEIRGPWSDMKKLPGFL